jgi:uncharacterized protein (TIGR02271 family)
LTAIGQGKGWEKEGHTMYDRSQFRRGLEVYDRNGEKIGDISDVGSNYLHLSTGFLGLGQDHYFPFSMVDRVDDRGAHLNATKSELASRDWSKPPVETPSTPISSGAATAAGMMGAASTAAASGIGGTTVTPEDVRGRNLCDVNGKQIGSISGVGRDYFHVITGLLGLGQDLYVPINAVDHCNQTCCYLSMTTEDVKGRGWTTRPTAETFAGAERAATAGRTCPPEAPRNVYRIPLREEELEVHRHREQVGEVIISKDVVEEQRTINVPVSHEEVRIERRAVRGGTGDVGPITDESTKETVRVPVYEERIDVEKHSRVAEEIVVSPEETTREERVTQTVRREVPHLSTTGEADEFVEGEETIEGKSAAERTAEDVTNQARKRAAGE